MSIKSQVDMQNIKERNFNIRGVPKSFLTESITKQTTTTTTTINTR
jgi:hypothetical protein